MMEQIIVTAVNKYGNHYYFLEVPKENFSLIKECIEKFYNMVPKTIDEVLS